MAGSVHIGLSGYSYKPWQGEDRFYPPELKQAEFLEFYAARYAAVEMDGSWYRTPSVDAVSQWVAKTPSPFQFSFKVHRRISHIARLKPECFEELRFICKRLAPMASVGKLGPFLVQLPPNLKKDEARLTAFVAALPGTFDGVEGYTGEQGRPVRWSMEFRHDSWNCDTVAEILRSRNVAWVASDTDELRATRRDTATHHYLRIRRTDTDREVLDDWAEYLRTEMDKGRDCYVFCKHEDEGAPWEWADYLISRLA